VFNQYEGIYANEEKSVPDVLVKNKDNKTTLVVVPEDKKEYHFLKKESR